MNGLSLEKILFIFVLEPSRTGKYDFWVICRNISVRQVELLGFDFIFSKFYFEKIIKYGQIK